jgi:hypothetical protein
MDLIQFLQSMSLAILAGLTAVIWKEVLGYKLPFINRFFQWGSRFENRWFYKPIWGCSQCFAGQFALWVYLFTHFKVVILSGFGPGWLPIGKVVICSTNLQYSITGHILAVSAAIYLATIFTNIFNRAENGQN